MPALRPVHVSPRIVCLHSSGASSRQWQPLAERLGDVFDVVAPDLHGHGAGPAWLGSPGDILAADVALVLRLALREPRGVHLVGHSYGGAVALRAAMLHPERVRSVTVYEPVLFRVLRDFAPRSREAAEVSGIASAVRRDLVAGMDESASRRFVDYWSGAGTFDAMPADRRAAVVKRMHAVSGQFAALWNDAARLRDYARIRLPVTLLNGARTRTPVRRIAELLRHAIPDIRSGALPAMGHMGPLTHPGIVAQRIASEVRMNELIAASFTRRLAA